MSKVKLNPVIEQLRGQIGDLVFKRYHDRTILSRKPDSSDRPWSAAQMLHRERFGQASRYGRQVMADPALRALYQAAATACKQPLFSLIVGDYLNAPVVQRVDLEAFQGASGDRIVVDAQDDFSVTRVRVEVRSNGGAVLESGEALETPAGSGQWRYTVQTNLASGTTVQVEAQAYDRPGGMGRLEVQKTV